MFFKLACDKRSPLLNICVARWHLGYRPRHAHLGCNEAYKGLKQNCNAVDWWISSLEEAKYRAVSIIYTEHSFPIWCILISLISNSSYSGGLAPPKPPQYKLGGLTNLLEILFTTCRCTFVCILWQLLFPHLAAGCWSHFYVMLILHRAPSTYGCREVSEFDKSGDNSEVGTEAVKTFTNKP